jgi:hypothetical protein
LQKLILTEILWKRKSKLSCLKQCHFSFEVLILTSIILEGRGSGYKGRGYLKCKYGKVEDISIHIGICS